MLVIGGFILVVSCVFGGFALAGGHLAALFQPLELLMIGGGALGAFFVGNHGKAVRPPSLFPSVFKGSKYSLPRYMDTLALRYEVLTRPRKERLMLSESDVVTPPDSPPFSKYPTVAAAHPGVDLTGYPRLWVSGSLPAFGIASSRTTSRQQRHADPTCRT